MPRIRVSLVVAGLCLAVVAPALAESPKPLAVLSLASYDDARFNVESVGFVAESPEMPTSLSSLIRLYAQGRELTSLDASKPWGAVIQLADGKLSAYGFAPVTDPESLAWDLDEYIDSTTEVGDGVYKVVGTEPGKQLYAKVVDGWIFAADCPEALDSVPADPATLLEGANKKYDVAVRLVLKNVPADAGKEILAKLDETVGPTLRAMSCGKTVEILGKMAWHLDEVTLGWSKR
jgi:hypothetical protein